MSDEFAFIELPLIEPSLTNPRKTFNEAKLQELATSIKASGVHQPILVRKLPAARLADTSTDPATGKPRKVRPTYELVCGERRYRASKLAEVVTIPALIRDLTDDQVLEIQIIENLQRDDLTELEEAEGYEALMQHSGLTADQVGEKIGKSRSYVYGRLKLLDLTQESKQAMRDGTLDASRALLIARIPDGKLQLKALEYTTEPEYSGGDLPSVRSLKAWLQRNVMLRLEHAIFKITDVRLVESAGSCTDCPKRTGANPDLFADVDSADICTDPACYHGKEEAHRAELVKRAESKGLRIVQDKEALELLEGRQYWNKPDGYTDLSEKRPDLSQEGDRPLTLGQALGKDAPAPILFIHPRTQQVSELVPSDEAEAVLLAKGLIKVEEVRAEKLEDLTKELTRLQDGAKHATERAVSIALEKEAALAIHQTTTAQAKNLLSGEVLRAFLLAELDDYGGEDEIAECANYSFPEGVDEMDAITAHLQRMGDTDLLRTTAAFLLSRAGMTSDEPDNPVATAIIKQLGIDAKGVVKQAQANVKAEYAERIKEVQTQIDAQKAPPATAPAARPKEGPGGKGASGKKAKAPAPRMTTEEATQGIADALQGIDGASAAPEGAVASPAKPAGGKPAAMYRGPNGETWSGRGLMPKWLQVLLDAGGTKEQYLAEKMPAPVQAWPFPTDPPKGSTLSAEEQAAAEEHDLYDKAVDLVIREQKASKRLLKEKLGIGQDKALALLERMEKNGVVSEVDETRNRKVLVAA